MPRILYVHWHVAEAVERSRDLQAAGYTVAVHGAPGTPPALKDNLPDVLVVSLDRLPAHGRAIAEWLWAAKSRQHIPIVFEGGAPEKVEATRAKFPTAEYCATGEVRSVLAALEKPRAVSEATNAVRRREMPSKARRAGHHKR